MGTTFYLDESGHSGDMVNSGDGFDFKGQPYFVLAAVGLSNEIPFASHVAELRALHRIPEGELKSKSLTSKPKFVADVIYYLLSINAPMFIEVVDKRYFICANITSFQLLPGWMGFSEGPGTTYIRNAMADFLCSEATDQLLDAFVQACLDPSEERLLQSFSFLQGLGNSLLDVPGKGEIAQGLVMMVEDARAEYQKLREMDIEAYLRFLPPPDYNKRSKRVWMLPNLTSFTNIYARLNRYSERNLNGIHIVHDQQLEIEDILHLGKATAESLTQASKLPYTPNSDYVFENAATFTFAQSHEGVGVQLADIVAGAVMRYFRDYRHSAPETILTQAVKRLIANFDPRTSCGVNLVVATRDVRYTER